MTPHIIRLRGFWTTTELEPGRVRHARHFGRPRTLDADETVWLVGTATGTVWLNEQPLGESHANFAFDVTTHLLPRNTIGIETSPSESPTDVRLEIRG